MPDTPLADGHGSFERPIEAMVDDAVAMLRIVDPPWLGFYDPDLLGGHVASQLMEGDETAREHGNWQTGGLRVEHDAELGKTEVWVLVGYSYDETEEEATDAES